MGILEQLSELRTYGGERTTVGLSDEILHRFADDARLRAAVAEAIELHRELRAEYGTLLKLDEAELVDAVQRGIVNFYASDQRNPYVALAARGPWLITTTGAVLHDSGGYGMLGLGHAPAEVLEAMSQTQVMANVMTPSLSQMRMIAALKREIGHTRGRPAFEHFVFLNSGSEAVTVGARMSDLNARIQTDPGGRHAGRPIKKMSLTGGFHGRTDRPAQYSDSSRRAYEKYLATFRGRTNLITVPPNDVAALRQAFADAERDGVFIESLFMEPVMGEGNPGQAITPEFYRAAREATQAHGALLLIDSIQAGLRATGHLSIVDYPGFEEVEPPDMETYSKALNAGQYPLSVLALSERTARLYQRGLYGNTMTANPRAMDVGVRVLESITPELRENIRARGREFLTRLERLAGELDGLITKVQGTGLLFSCEVADRYRAYGSNSLEEYLRIHGIGVIHGGKNSLRYTPHFAVTSAEVDLIVEATRDALLNGPSRDQEEEEDIAALAL